MKNKKMQLKVMPKLLVFKASPNIHGHGPVSSRRALLCIIWESCCDFK